ncbi:aminotransferase class V-fold PLP-dependent enzyme [bacterium]|nr:MAG: aminotransferase class V-fold PLP-dependent enzyme [bacterium]
MKPRTPDFYLDHAATSPLRPEAKEAMLPWLDAGNASSQHREGRRARAAIDAAREVVAASMGRDFADIVFTSGGTESVVLAIMGAALGNVGRDRVLFPANEHHCVLHTAPLLQRLGFRVETIPVDAHGVAIPRTLEGDVALVSVMHGNNETGAINDVARWQGLAEEAGAVFHTDAVQTYSRLPVPDADLVSISGHKVGGPKGVGVLAIRPGVSLVALSGGGGQERERRGGTEDVASIVGFGAVAGMRAYDYAGATAFRRKLVEGGAIATLSQALPHLPGIVHLRFPGQRADTLLVRLDRAGVAASAGAACSSGSLEPSHVLMAQGCSEEEAREGVRFSFRGDEDAAFGETAADLVLDVVRSIREPRRGGLRHT